MEHRAAASIKPLSLELRTANSDAVALHIIEDPQQLDPAQPASPTERVENALAQAAEPLSMRALRAACRMRTATVSQAVTELKRDGRVVEHDGGFRLP